MIRCKECKTGIGELDHFGFLVFTEAQGRETYHFVVEKDFMEGFEGKFLDVKTDFVKRLYYIVNCQLCDSDLGKKFVTSSARYIAFGKEKLVYDEVELKKTDKWLPLLNTLPFKDLRKFTIMDFRTKIYDPKTTRRGRGDQPQMWGLRGNDQRAPLTPKEQSNQHRRGNLTGNSYSKKEDYHNTTSAQKPSQIRPTVGTTLSDKIKYLQQKQQNWDAAKLIHELTGPSKDNWQAIIGGLSADITGSLMREVFILLSNAQIRDDPRAIDLYIPLTDPMAIMGMTFYVTTGPLGKQSVESAGGNPGGSSWISLLHDTLSAVETVAFMVSKFVAFQSNPTLGLLVMTLKTSIDTLFGSSFRETRAFINWSSNSSEQTKIKALNDATLICKKLDNIDEVQRESTQANLNSVQDKEKKDKAREVADRSANQRFRDGIVFLDDVERDRDYLSISIVPRAVELTAAPPVALPLNIVCDGILHDDDVYRPSKRSTSIRYRSIDHYINTHFLLIREECLAQLRRGVSALRELLGEKSHEIEIAKPSRKALENACKQFIRLRGNDAAYLYDSVTVHSVDRMHEGIGYVVSFQMFENRKVDWKISSRFMNGSLLCLSSNGTFNQSSFVVATVLRGVQQPPGTSHNNNCPTIFSFFIY